MAATTESPFFYSGVVNVRAISGRNLIAADSNGLSDPYLKLTVLPDAPDAKKNKHRAKTAVIKKTLNPDWNEDLVLEFTDAKYILLQCKDEDMLGHNDPMGYVQLNIGTDLASCREKDMTLRLLPDADSGLPTVLGEIRIRAKFTDSGSARLAAVYDVSLEQALLRSPDSTEALGVPACVKLMADTIIMKGGLATEGIFRVPGDAVMIQRIKEYFNNGELSVIDDASVESVGGAFKLWFRELAEPLIPASLYPDALVVTPETAAGFMATLPDANRLCLNFLFDFLLGFTEDEAVVARTLMGIKNMAMVFGPSLLRAPSDAAMLADNDRVINAIVTLLKERLRSRSMRP